MSTPVAILLNGEPTTAQSASVLELLRARGIDPDRRGIAVALNDAVVPRSDWGATPLPEGSRIEIIAPIQGG